MLPSDQDDKEDPQREECNTVVYIHRKGDENGSPFYVGMGKPSRAYAFSKDSRTAWWHNTKNKYGVFVEIYKEGLSIKEAYSLEIDLIEKFGRKQFGGLLVNLSSGGEYSNLGSKRSREFRAKQCIKRSKAVINADTNQIYPSARIAAMCLNKPNSHGDISRVCNGKRNLKVAIGFRWKFA